MTSTKQETHTWPSNCLFSLILFIFIGEVTYERWKTAVNGLFYQFDGIEILYKRVITYPSRGPCLWRSSSEDVWRWDRFLRVSVCCNKDEGYLNLQVVTERHETESNIPTSLWPQIVSWSGFALNGEEPSGSISRALVHWQEVSYFMTVRRQSYHRQQTWDAVLPFWKVLVFESITRYIRDFSLFGVGYEIKTFC
jgi:hypothetical protein